MRVQAHDEPAGAAFGSQTVRQSLQRAALHIDVISSGLLTLLLSFRRLFGELQVHIVSLTKRWDWAQSVAFVCTYRCISVCLGEYSTIFMSSSVDQSSGPLCFWNNLVRKSLFLMLWLSHKHTSHTHTPTPTHTRGQETSLIEFIGEWMLTRPLQVG